MSLYVTGEKRPKKEIPNFVVYEALRRFPERVIGFVMINPLEEAEAYQTFDVAVKEGCRGVKLNPIAHRFSFSGRVLDHLAEECARRKMPIYSHALFDAGANTIKYGDFAKRHPNTTFILGHMGFGSCDSHAFQLARELPNLFLETSLGTFMAVREALRIAGPEKLLFGSEFPMSTPKIGMFQIRELPAEFHERILYRNMAAILRNA